MRALKRGVMVEQSPCVIVNFGHILPTLPTPGDKVLIQERKLYPRFGQVEDWGHSKYWENQWNERSTYNPQSWEETIFKYLFQPLLQYPDGRVGGCETNASLFAGIASSILHPLGRQYRDQQRSAGSSVKNNLASNTQKVFFVWIENLRKCIKTKSWKADRAKLRFLQKESRRVAKSIFCLFILG